MRPETRMGLWLFGAALGLRLAALAVLGFHPEPFEYEGLARSLLAGHGYARELYGTVHRAQGPPLYTFLCAGLYLLTGSSRLAVVGVQIVLSALLPVVVYRIARRLGLSSALAAAAAAPAVVHPGLTVYAVGKLHPLGLDALLIALCVWAVLALRRARAPGAFAGAGALLGLAVLSRPTVGLFGPLALLWLWWGRRPGPPARLLARLALFALAALAVVAPWTIRNYVVLGRLVPITTDTAELFWRGNHAGASGSAYLPDGRVVLAGAPEAFQAAIRSRDELGQADLFRAAAREFVTEHPGAFVALLLRKWRAFWWFSETAGLLYPRAWLAAYKAFYLALASLAVVGALAVAGGRAAPRWDRSGFLLLALLCLAVAVAQSLYYVDVRHRWGIEALLGVFAAAGVGWLAGRARPGGDPLDAAGIPI